MTQVEHERLKSMGIPSDKLATIGVGIDFRQATGGDATVVRERYHIDGPVVLHLGVKAYEKGSMTLIEAMKILWERGSPAWLLMAGPSLSEFDLFVAKQPPLPRLINLPAFVDKEKRDLLAAATVVAQPSRVESLGLVLLEAWANAKAVVAADIAVSRQLVERNGGGVVTPFGNSAALAREIEILLGDSELCRELGLRGRETARAYDGNLLWRRNAEVFEPVTNTGRCLVSFYPRHPRMLARKRTAAFAQRS
jgi:glycosyltransferase involved in cell wall biosynthesis